MESPILVEINRLSDKRFCLYRELDALIEDKGHIGYFQPQSQEIRQLNFRLRQLWKMRRAEGKYYMARPTRSKYGEAGKEWGKRMHGYGK